MKQVAGLILAAGESRRMGRCKATLPLGNITLIEWIVKKFLEVGINKIQVVTGKDHKQIQEVLEEKEVQIVQNLDWKEGQLSSLQCGLRVLGHTQSIIITLVDHPGYSKTLLASLMENYKPPEVAGVIPKYSGHPGHPVLMGPEIVEEWLQLSPTRDTARDAFKKFSNRICYFETDESAILRDLDTEEEYQQFLVNWEKERFSSGVKIEPADS